MIDPANDRDEAADVLLCDGKIKAVGSSLEAPPDGEIINCSGKVVCPGLIDLHVHFREPGQSAKETIATGSAAAAMGGFLSLIHISEPTRPY